ncbi:MAG: hypothetical protein P0Y65_13770 [Candidatus Devosia phytovorans]|uniref:Uncharacterized protein n=1 Tax=Candidatus Devosia phytovorans TaxID=3121372 RepID=A0AAJ6AY75_9HYPH|nr:hypothetical protein [Devosia sp.]WEK03260.1 MAG: hypothetical protein P0Y65_13770 [Devosia sp.]
MDASQELEQLKEKLSEACPEMQRINGLVEGLELTAQRIRLKLSEASNALQQPAILEQRKARILVAVSERQAAALIDDDGADVEDLQIKLQKIANDLKSAEMSAKSAKIAQGLLKTKLVECEGSLATMKERLSTAERRWLRARRAIVDAKLRRGIDQLKGTIAELLAVETHRSNNEIGMGYEVAGAFLKRLGAAFPPDAAYAPRWIYSPSASAFPGYDDAVLALAAELVEQIKIANAPLNGSSTSRVARCDSR